MHKCKTSETIVTELALEEAPPAERKRLLAEIQDCPDCLEEYVSVKSALRATDDALRSFAPRETFWNGYHSRLQQRLVSSSAATNPLSSWSARIRQLLATSIRVPVPVAVALILALVATAYLTLNRAESRAAVNEQSIPTQTRIIDVPVFREQVVTRVVYVKKSLPSVSDSTRQKDAEPRDGAVATLSGFQPTDQINLTVIRGSAVDDK